MEVMPLTEQRRNEIAFLLDVSELGGKQENVSTVLVRAALALVAAERQFETAKRHMRGTANHVFVKVYNVLGEEVAPSEEEMLAYIEELAKKIRGRS